MKREVAERLANAMKAVEKALGELADAISAAEDRTERDLMIDTLGETIHFFHANISVPIARHFPDLHPDVPGSTRY